MIIAQTLEACNRGYYITEKKTKIELPEKELSKCFEETFFYDSPKDLIFEKKFETKIQVINDDCLTIGIQLKKEGLNPVVLNMMNPIERGNFFFKIEILKVVVIKEVQQLKKNL